jgi:hypothetical protein
LAAGNGIWVLYHSGKYISPTPFELFFNQCPRTTNKKVARKQRSGFRVSFSSIVPRITLRYIQATLSVILSSAKDLLFAFN